MTHGALSLTALQSAARTRWGVLPLRLGLLQE